MTSTNLRVGIAFALALASIAACQAVETSNDDATAQGEAGRDGASLAESSDAIFGASTVSGCTTEQSTLINKALHHGRRAVGTRAFEQCIDARLRTLYEGCTDDPYLWDGIDAQVRAAIEVARSPNPVSMNCGGSGPEPWRSTLVWTPDRYDYGHEQFEVFNWDSALLDQALLGANSLPICGPSSEGCIQNGWAGAGTPGPGCTTGPCRLAVWPASLAAGNLWGELARNHSYNDGGPPNNARANCGISPTSTWDQLHDTVPKIIDDCVSDVIERSEQRCGAITLCGKGDLNLLDTFEGTTCSCVAEPGATETRIFYYDTTSSVDASGRMEVDGLHHTLQQFTDVANGWTHIVSPGYRRLFFYNKNNGNITVERLADDGTRGHLYNGSLPAGYDHVTHAGLDGNVLLYSSDSGDTMTLRVGATSLAVVSSGELFDADWTHVTESGGLLLFYNSNVGGGAVYEGDKNGAYTYLYPVSNLIPGFTHVSGRDGMLLFYSRNSGFVRSARLTHQAYAQLQSFWFSPGWDKVEQLGHREMLVYNGVNGIGVSGRLDFNGVFTQHLTMQFSPAWSIIAPRR